MTSRVCMPLVVLPRCFGAFLGFVLSSRRGNHWALRLDHIFARTELSEGRFGSTP